MRGAGRVMGAAEAAVSAAIPWAEGNPLGEEGAGGCREDAAAVRHQGSWAEGSPPCSVAPRRSHPIPHALLCPEGGKA